MFWLRLNLTRADSMLKYAVIEKALNLKDQLNIFSTKEI
jgi:hypothetical protein